MKAKLAARCVQFFCAHARVNVGFGCTVLCGQSGHARLTNKRAGPARTHTCREAELAQVADEFAARQSALDAAVESEVVSERSCEIENGRARSLDM